MLTIARPGRHSNTLPAARRRHRLNLSCGGEVGGSVAQLGQHDAFVEYVLPEIDVLYRVARSLTSQPADAEDLVQDTLLRAFR
ncbi:MAG: RNA polymerase sigma factor, partial [Pseudonocardiaceae bacterium]